MSSLELDDFTDLIERPDGGVGRDAEARRERRIVPPGALGRLDERGGGLAAARGPRPGAPGPGFGRCRVGRSGTRCRRRLRGASFRHRSVSRRAPLRDLRPCVSGCRRQLVRGAAGDVGRAAERGESEHRPWAPAPARARP
ncbi:hypothetical protein ACWGKX_39470, partial [Streptomyces tricolor]